MYFSDLYNETEEPLPEDARERSQFNEQTQSLQDLLEQTSPQQSAYPITSGPVPFPSPSSTGFLGDSDPYVAPPVSRSNLLHRSPTTSPQPQLFYDDFSGHSHPSTTNRKELSVYGEGVTSYEQRIPVYGMEAPLYRRELPMYGQTVAPYEQEKLLSRDAAPSCPNGGDSSRPSSMFVEGNTTQQSFPYPSLRLHSTPLSKEDERNMRCSVKRRRDSISDRARILKKISTTHSHPDLTSSPREIEREMSFSKKPSSVPELLFEPGNPNFAGNYRIHSQVDENLRPDSINSGLQIFRGDTVIPLDSLIAPGASEQLGNNETVLGNDVAGRSAKVVRDGVYEVKKSGNSGRFYASSTMQFKADSQKLFNFLCFQANKAEPEGFVRGAGVKVEDDICFLYKIIECKNTVRCEKCQKVFRNETLLSVHTKKKHSATLREAGIESVSCSNCGEVFESIANLRRHVTLAHSGNALFTCSECLATFTCRHPYVIHLRDMHNITPRTRRPPKIELTYGELPETPFVAYKCCSCTTISANKGNMIRHIKLTHLKVKPFRCDICNLSFGTEHNLHCHRTSIHMNN